MAVTNPYAFPNIGSMRTNINRSFKDCERAAISREDLATILRSMADKLEQRKPEDRQFTLDEVAEHIKAKYGDLQAAKGNS